MQKDSRYKEFSHFLVRKRIEAGLTQSQLAEKISKPQSFISKYESFERRLDVIEFIDICIALNTTSYILLKEFEQNAR
jgi:transcriptional regulator with XRE-family HTH domain